MTNWWTEACWPELTEGLTEPSQSAHLNHRWPHSCDTTPRVLLYLAHSRTHRRVSNPAEVSAHSLTWQHLAAQPAQMSWSSQQPSQQTGPDLMEDRWRPVPHRGAGRTRIWEGCKEHSLRRQHPANLLWAAQAHSSTSLRPAPPPSFHYQLFEPATTWTAQHKAGRAGTEEKQEGMQQPQHRSAHAATNSAAGTAHQQLLGIAGTT